MRPRVLPLVVIGGLNVGFVGAVASSDVIGRVGTNADLPCPAEAASLCAASLIDWRWRPLKFNGWGWQCERRNNSCSWEWDQLEELADEWRAIYELDTVVRTTSGLRITDLGMHDNRQYAAVEAETGNVIRVYSVKVGRKPSYPTDINCISFVEQMIMRCKWDVGLQSFLPWAKSTTSLFYRKFVISAANDEELQKLAFDKHDELHECDSYCTQGNIGCCELKLTSDDLIDYDPNKMITYQMQINTTNLFGSSTMQKLPYNSEIMNETPVKNVKPVTPTIVSVSPPDFDGYSMEIAWTHGANPSEISPESVMLNSTMYNYKVEYRLKNDLNQLQWQRSKTTLKNSLILRSMLVPFHDYEFRVLAKPVVFGFWSDPSAIVVARTKATEPTAKLNPKYSIISYSGKFVKVRFFWLPYQQQNAPNNRFRLRVKSRNCPENGHPTRTMFDELIRNATKTSYEVELNVANMPCIKAEFVVENDKGGTKPESIPIDLFKVDATAPDILIEPESDGHFQMRPAHADSTLNNNITNPEIYVCYGQSSECAAATASDTSQLISQRDVSCSPICHKQKLTESDRVDKDGWFKSKAVLTPCYNYNIYLEVTSKSNNSTIRSLPKSVTLPGLKVHMGQIVKVKDVSKEGSTDVQITYDLVDKNNIDIIYGMHPAISYRDLATNIVHHKKIKTTSNMIRLNETDGIVGGGQSAFWLSLCCDERMREGDVCFRQTTEKITSISAGTPGTVGNLKLVWSKEAESYMLRFNEPEKTNSILRSYQIFVRYTRNGEYADQGLSVPAKHSQTLVKLEPVCRSMLDDVHVTILAYGSDMKNGLLPGHPLHRYFRCGDLIIVGLSAGIMFTIALLIISLIVMLVMSYIHRRRIKSYVVNAVWPDIDKAEINFAPTNRDDFGWDANEKSELLNDEFEEADVLPEIINIKMISDKRLQSANNSGGFSDSGISDYSSGASSKSVPIYRLTGYRIDFRRTSNASSGISSQHSGNSNSGKSGIQSIHTVSSNHSGDSVLAKSEQNWGKGLHPQKIDREEDNYVGSMPGINVGNFPSQLAQYSLMGDTFNEETLRNRSPMFPNTANGYIGHGYVENSLFNLTNMPTVFLENFKKIQRFQEMSENDRDEYIQDNLGEYGGYKPISALFPKKEPLPPGYTMSNIFDVQSVSDSAPSSPTQKFVPTFDDYVSDNFLPESNIRSFQPPISQQAGYLPFDRAMKTFGIDEICVDKLLSSKVASIQQNKIAATYVTDYSSNFNLLSRNNIHVPHIGSKQTEVPGYVSIEGAQILQQYT